MSERPVPDSAGSASIGGIDTDTLGLGLIIVGVALLATAVGMAINIDVVSLAISLVEREAGRWLFLAIFVVALVVIAIRGIETRTL